VPFEQILFEGRQSGSSSQGDEQIFVALDAVRVTARGMCPGQRIRQGTRRPPPRWCPSRRGTAHSGVRQNMNSLPLSVL